MFDLSDYLPYLLYRTGAQIADRFSTTLRIDHGISLPMWRVLAALNHRDGQRVGHLAMATTIEVSTLSRLISTLQRRGLVARQRPPVQAIGEDARAVTIHLTQSGRALTERIIPLARDYEQAALSGFTEAELATLRQMLQRVYDNMARRASGEANRSQIAS